MGLFTRTIFAVVSRKNTLECIRVDDTRFATPQTRFRMSDTDNKKPSKSSDNSSSSKKRAAAAAAVADAQDDSKTVDDALASPMGSPQSRKRVKTDKTERKNNKIHASAPTSAVLDIVKTLEIDEGNNEDAEDTFDTPNTTVVSPEILKGVSDDVDVVTAVVKIEMKDKVETEDKVDVLGSGINNVLKMCASVRKLAFNAMLASKGPAEALTITARPETLVLVMITKDMERESKMGKERGALFTSISFVTLKILEAGFNSAPYEKVEGANAKQLVFCDKKGKMLDKGRPTKLASVSVIDGVKHLDMRTWEPHPSAMMKNKWRGTPTDCVGVVAPGVPFSCNIFNENKDSIMENDSTELNLKPFSLAILGLSIKSREQCVAGYGIAVKSVRHIEGVNVAMTGLYHDDFFYTDRRGIMEQTNDRLQLITRVKEYTNDLSFVCKLVRNKDEVTEMPVVCILPTQDMGVEKSRKQYTVHMQPNNKVLELAIVDEGSIYHEKRFRVTIPDNMFTIEETGLPWIQFYLQWMLNANACRIMIVHNEYQFKRMSDGTGSASMHCALVPDEERLFSDKNAALVLSPAIMSSLNDRIKGRKNTLDMYTGWVIHVDESSNTTYAMLFDKTKAYGPEIEKPVVEAAPISAAEGAVEVGAEVCVQDGAEGMDVNVAVDSECDPAGEHTSIICRIYKGMNPARHIWRGYLLTIDNENDEVQRLFQIGIKSKPAYLKTAADGGVSANADIFETCDMLFD
jgi:hypothetical protein